MRRVLGCFLATLLCATCAAADRPNIVFIMADDLGYTDLSCFGSDYYQTPNLDRLATRGMVFTDAYANCANCAPTRAALMSGMYAPRTGVYTVGSPDRGKAKDRALIPTPNTDTLAAEVVTLAEVLHDAGYTTAHMGKWHLGNGETGPLNQGFDINVAGNRRGHPATYFSPYNNPDITDGPEGEYLTDRIAREAVGFMAKHAKDDAPFFLYLPLYTVHTPIQPHADFVQRVAGRVPGKHHSNEKYAAFVDGMDFYVGRVLDAIDELGLAENTLVVFTSDNGGHGSYTDQHPLRGSKGMFYEGGIRVPLIVRYPGVTQAGAVCDEPVLLFDFYPTFTGIGQGELPTTQPVDGIDLAPLLRDANAELDREAIYFHFPAYLQGYAGGEGAEAHNPPWRATPCSVIRAGNWKLIEYFETGEVELFNLAEDLGEQHNLAEQHPDRAAALLEKLHAWHADVKAPIPTEQNPQYQP